MLFLPLAAVAGLVVPAVDAAPKGLGSKQFDTRDNLARHLQSHDSGHYKERRAPRQNFTPTPGGPLTANINGTTFNKVGATASRQYYATDLDECPTGDVVVSTVTVDVTVYATAPAATEDCDDDVATNPIDGTRTNISGDQEATPIPKPGDKDGDGVPDEKDPSDEDPSIPGTDSEDGSEAEVDTDGDGKPDAVPKDVDGDGVDELVPTDQTGSDSTTPGGSEDKDGDGIPADEDPCDEDPNVPNPNGDGDDDVPEDTDGDGKDELVPEDEAGKPKPGDNDKDGDGVPDAEDPCPEDPSVPVTNGTTIEHASTAKHTTTPGAGTFALTMSTPTVDEASTTHARATPDATAPGYGSVKPDDKDDDGIPAKNDPNDNDPNTPIPAATPTPGDMDRDGVPTKDDPNDNDLNTPIPSGTPKPGDKDGDGVPTKNDPNDNDPNTPLPTPSPTPVDMDGDGVPAKSDPNDEDPNTPIPSGTPKPGDKDGDGIPAKNDPNDKDPKTPLPSATPMPIDMDGDGTPDGEDPCPEDASIPGTPELVPTDTTTVVETPSFTSTGTDPEDAVTPKPTDVDGDNVPDAEDPCPEDPAVPGTDGTTTGDGTPGVDTDDDGESGLVPENTNNGGDNELVPTDNADNVSPTPVEEDCETTDSVATDSFVTKTRTPAATPTETDCDEEPMEEVVKKGSDLMDHVLEKRGKPVVTTIPIIDNTKYRATTTNPVIIDTSITPAVTPTTECDIDSPAVPTATMCVHDVEDGDTDVDVAYCGVNGRPVGTYFLAEFIEQRSGEPVTEEGCYQFCDSVMDTTAGCQSYRFYHNDAGAPRCALYGSSVTKAIFNLDADKEDTWWDLSCGSPSAEDWHKSMPGHY